DVISHRRPGDEGRHLAREVGDAVRRLSIIDVASGRQPITDEDGSIVVAFNGEIYNYRQLSRQLQSRGHRFATASDTEAIVHLYEECGEACVESLRGMFGLAVWDSRTRRLFLARDRLGIKPLYYTLVNGKLIFGSEIKSILQHPDVVVRPNLKALGHFLSLKYVPAPLTMFEGIHALPPAHTLTCHEDGVRIRSYWDVSFGHQRDGLPESAYAEQLQPLLKDSVKEHLMSDVPFGACLSGGVDCRTLVALLGQLLTGRVNR